MTKAAHYKAQLKNNKSTFVQMFKMEYIEAANTA